MKHPKKRKQTNSTARHRPAHYSAIPPSANADESVPELNDGDKDVGARFEDYIDQIKSDDPSVRELGASAIGILVSSPKNVSVGLQLGVDATLIAVLKSEDTVAVKAEIIGSLRNLIISSDDHQISTKLVESGIMKALSDTLPLAVTKVLEVAANPSMDTKTSLRDSRENEAMQTLLHQGVMLLCELAETSEMAMTVLNSGLLGAAVLSYIGSPVSRSLPTGILSACVQCLQTISEDNSVMARIVNSSSGSSTNLIGLLEYAEGRPGRNYCIKVAAAGSILNISLSAASQNLCTAELDGVTAVLDTLGSAVGVDSAATMGDLASNLASLRKQSSNNEIMEKVIDFGVMLQAQQNALEILANACCADASTEEWDGINGESMPDDPGLDPLRNEASAAMLSLFFERNIPTLLLSRSTQLHLGVQQMFLGNKSHGEPMLLEYLEMQTRALGVLANIFSVAPGNSIDHEFVEACWNTFSTQFGEPPTGASESFAESVTAAVWALARYVALTPKAAIDSLSSAHMQALAGMITSSVEAVRINTVGTLACIGKMGPAQDTLSLVASSLKRALDDSSGWVKVEALNGIFDGFDEENCNNIFVELQLMDRLSEELITLEGLMRTGEHMDPELFGKLDETKENLEGFIEYKREQF